MSSILLLNGLSYFAVAVVAFFVYIGLRRSSDLIKTIARVVGFSGLFYLGAGAVHMFWFKGAAIRSADIVFLLTVVAVLTAVVHSYVTYRLTESRAIPFLFIVYLVGLFAINYSLTDFFLATILLSILLTIILFLELSRLSNVHFRMAGLFGLMYGVGSLVVGAFMFKGVEPQNIWWIAPQLALAILFVFLYMGLKGTPASAVEKRWQRGTLPLTSISVSSTLFILSIGAFLLVITLSVHGAGHGLVAQYYGCELQRADVYAVIGSPDVTCESGAHETVLRFGGLAATAIMAAVLVVVGGELSTLIALFIFGAGLGITYSDFVELGVSGKVVGLIIFLSIAGMAYTLFHFATLYIHRRGIGRKFGKGSVHPERYFKLHSGEIVRDLYELVHALHTMDESTYSHHVNDERNDFSNWIRDVFHDSRLARQTGAAKDRHKIASLILQRLLEAS